MYHRTSKPSNETACPVSSVRWSLNQRWAPLRRVSASSKKPKRARTGAGDSGSGSDAASWEADWRSAKTVEAGLSGYTDDLVRDRCRHIQTGGSPRVPPSTFAVAFAAGLVVAEGGGYLLEEGGGARGKESADERTAQEDIYLFAVTAPAAVRVGLDEHPARNECAFYLVVFCSRHA